MKETKPYHNDTAPCICGSIEKAILWLFQWSHTLFFFTSPTSLWFVRQHEFEVIRNCRCRSDNRLGLSEITRHILHKLDKLLSEIRRCPEPQPDC